MYSGDIKVDKHTHRQMQTCRDRCTCTDYRQPQCYMPLRLSRLTGSRGIKRQNIQQCEHLGINFSVQVTNNGTNFFYRVYSTYITGVCICGQDYLQHQHNWDTKHSTPERSSQDSYFQSASHDGGLERLSLESHHVEYLVLFSKLNLVNF